MNRLFRSWLFAAVAISTALIFVGESFAQRPTAPQLLPHYTLAAVRIVDTPLLVERFQQTALGRIGQDPRMKPLAGQIYGAAQDAFGKNEQRVGLPLDELLAVPQGEVCIGFVAAPEGEPGFVVVIDTKDKTQQARKLIPAAEELARRITERMGFDSDRLYVEERDGTFILATTRPIMQTVLANFDGVGVEKTLADSEKYTTVLNRCLGQGDEQPQISWYVDPIALVRRLASGSLAATGLALFPVLGLDGLEAVGGTMTFSAGEFDQVQHFHVLLNNPRVGVIDAIGLMPGDMTPEAWVPADCVSYSTIHWDLRHTFNASSKLFNGIMGDGELERRFRNGFSAWLGADFEKEMMPLLAGRATLVNWVERPVQFNSVTTLAGLQLKDPKAFRPVIDKIVQKHADRMEKQRYGDVAYWSLKGDSLSFFPWLWPQEQQQRQSRKAGADLRKPLPCIGIVNDYLVMTDSMKVFQEAVTAQTNPDQSLATSLDFKLIASKIKRQPGGDAPGAVQFSRPEEGLRFWYDLVSAENTRKRLSEQGSRNRFFGSLDQALKDNPLPPFDVLAEYMAPGGGMIVNDETGIHYTTFTLKRK